jgi:hypothetical protein
MERRVLQVAAGPVGGVDVKGPGQAGRAAEELLVEVVPCAADGLRDEQRRRGGVHEPRDVRPRRRSTRRPPSVPSAIPPQILSPPFQIASGPHQWWGTSLQLVATK